MPKPKVKQPTRYIRDACRVLALVAAKSDQFTERARLDFLETLCLLTVGHYPPVDPETGERSSAAALACLEPPAHDKVLSQEIHRAVITETRRRAQIEAQFRAEWLAKLREAVDRATNRGLWYAIAGPGGSVALSLGGWDLHELYTRLVDDSCEPEACCAGCTQLPKGWCKICDQQRKPSNDSGA